MYPAVLSVCMAGLSRFTCSVVKCRFLLVVLCESSFPSEGGHVTKAETGRVNSGLDEFLIKSILSFAAVERPRCVWWCVCV